MITRLSVLFVVLSLLASALEACSGGGSQSTTPDEAEKFASLKGDAKKGETAFAGTCVPCHGPDAKGMPGLGKDLTTSTFVKDTSDAELILFVTKGRPAGDPLNTTGVDMPPRGGNPALKDQDLADIVAYLHTLQK